jgi:putative ABC transport system permease protein
MLMGDRAKYLGIVLGVTFASLLITQQLGIFCGLMTRTYGMLTDLSQPDVWVMDKEVQFIDDVKPLKDTECERVQGVPGVEWAVKLYKGTIRARLDNGSFQTCQVFGLDDASLIGGPPIMLEGSLADLRRSESVIVDDVGAADKLARLGSDGKTKIPLKIGDVMELNDHRAVVVGICRVTRTWQSQPVVFTTYTRATTYAPNERKLLSFVMVKLKPGQNAAAVCKQITQRTGMAAMTRNEFANATLWYFMAHTGIPINFGISVFLGFFVGTAVAGQTFFQFTHDNIKQFAALKAMGSGNALLLRMILLQAAVVGLIGYGLGVGITAVFGWRMEGTEMAFLLPWQLLLFTATAVLLICLLSALFSIRTVIRLEPAVVFKG